MNFIHQSIIDTQWSGKRLIVRSMIAIVCVLTACQGSDSHHTHTNHSHSHTTHTHTTHSHTTHTHTHTTPTSSTQTQTTQSPSSTIQIRTSLYPLQNLTHYLLQDLSRFEVHLLTKRAVDLAHFTPNDEEMKALHQADLIIFNGAQFEMWKNQVSLSERKILYSANHKQKDFLTLHHGTHKHGPHGEHTHADIDGHTWLDPIFLQDQIQQISQYITRKFIQTPKDKKHIQTRLQEIIKALQVLDQSWQQFATKHRAHIHYIANHEAYQYLAKRYQLSITSLDIDPQQALLPVQSKRIKKIAQNQKNKKTYLLWETASLTDTTKALQDMGIKSIILSPLENPTHDLLKKSHTTSQHTHIPNTLTYIHLMWQQIQNMQKIISTHP